MNKRKYPTLKTGYYTQEPLYGNLVREALRIGFKVFAYETINFRDSNPANREIQQALNIKKILDKDPKAKILIHCGYDHLAEDEMGELGKAMAGRLKEYTGIDPFTIDQTRLTEHSSLEYDYSVFKMLNLDYYAFFIDTSGKLFHGPPELNISDVWLYHPRTKWVNGRPHWVFENGREPYVIKEKIIVSFPCLVFAYLANEDLRVRDDSDKPVPYDIIELKNAEDKRALSLKKGHYTILIKDTNGKEQSFSVTMQ